jgi:hypothetical protein
MVEDRRSSVEGGSMTIKATQHPVPFSKLKRLRGRKRMQTTTKANGDAKKPFLSTAAVGLFRAAIRETEQRADAAERPAPPAG